MKATVAMLLALAAAQSGCASASSASSAAPASGAAGTAGTPSPAPDRREVEAGCGIRVEALRLSASGYVLDLRYRVVDPERAAPLLDGKQRPYLVDGRGAQLGVPTTPILGSLRQTSRNGRVSREHSYFILFANPARYLHAGDRVTLVVGDAKLPDLVVE